MDESANRARRMLAKLGGMSGANSDLKDEVHRKLQEAAGPTPQPPDPRLALAVAVRQLGRLRISPRELDWAAKGRLAIRQDEAGGWVFEWREAT